MKYAIYLRRAFATLLVISFVAVLGVLSASAGHNADGLAGFWNLDEGAGTDAFDTSSHSNDGAVDGASWVAGPAFVGNASALSFDGTDDEVVVPDASELDITDEITIAFWFDLDGDSADNDWPRAVSKGQSTGTDGAYGVFVKDTTDPTDIGLRFIDSGGVPHDVRDTTLPNYDGGWTHVAITYSNSADEGKIYLNGTLEHTEAIAGDVDIRTTADDLTIGNGSGDAERHFNGGIDEVRIYDRALSADEIEALQFYGNFAISLDPTVAMNPIGTDHTVTATIDPALAGIPILFHVNGPNATTTFPEYIYTNGDGEAKFTYTGALEGADTIWSCIDLSQPFTGGGICDAPSEFSEPFATSAKSWIVEHFVTGGGHYKDGKKNKWNWAGNVGRTSEGDVMGHFTIRDHKDKNTCHFDTFTSLSFHGTTTYSPTTNGVNEAHFTAEGWCKDGSTPTIDVIIVDNDEPGKDADTISVSNGSLDTGGTLYISGGNFQVHPPEESD